MIMMIIIIFENMLIRQPEATDKEGSFSVTFGVRCNNSPS